MDKSTMAWIDEHVGGRRVLAYDSKSKQYEVVRYVLRRKTSYNGCK